MPGPFITITTGRVREGRLAEYRELNAALTALVEDQEPRLIAFNVMLSADGEQFAGLQFHPDVQSMEFHLKVAAELIREAGDLLKVEAVTVLGPSNESFDSYLEAMAGSGIAVRHLPDHLGGFTRSSAVD